MSRLASVFALISVLSASCVTTEKESSLVKELNTEQKETFKKQLAELEVGRNMAGRLVTYYGVYEDDELVNYINQVGNYVASYSDFEDRRFMFHILDTDSYNAFASPGGFILISKGALRLANNEAELAMILGHEITHIGKQHMMRTLDGMDEKQLQSAADRVNASGGLPESVLARKRPTPEKSDFDNQTLVKYLGGAGAASINVVKSASAGMTLMLEKGMDHEYEFEADKLGVKYAVRAGYAPKALVQFFRRLMKAKGVDATIMTKTHPAFKDRIARLQQLFDEIEANEIVGAQGKKRYEKYKARLPAAK